jgi:hypothetical protein
MPPTGSRKLAVLLCKFQDTAGLEPEPVNYFRDLFVTRGTGGLNDYWTDASLGGINLDTTEIFEWHTIEQNRADFLSARPDRGSKIQGAVDAFQLERSLSALFTNIFNVLLFGAKDDSDGMGGGTDAAPAINAAILALDPLRGDIIEIPYGKYRIATPIHVQRGVID